MEDHDVDRVAFPAGLDGRRTGVARGGAHDGHPFAASGEFVVEQATHQLQGHVLEGQRRPVEQLHQVDAVGQLNQRRHVRDVEGRVGLAHHGGEVILVDGSGDERRHHLDRRLDVVALSSVG